LAVAAIGGALGFTLLSGCADMRDEVRDIIGDGDNEPRTLAFDCDDNRDFRVRLSGDRAEARVDADGRTYRLEEAGRDDGQRVYRDDDNEVRLTIGDDQANLRLSGGEDDYRDCRRS
jgi:hypothetical protein